MKEIKFRAKLGSVTYYVETVGQPLDGRGAHNFKGYEIASGYILRKVKQHPYANSRGYYPEHRLVVEESLGRFLFKDEVVHHIDGNRKNNELFNLKVITQSEHAGLEMRGKRNPNGTMVAKEPVFDEIKFRLHDTDRSITRIYTLSQLIGTTFRRGKFQFRGRFTGLHDKNGIPIFEGDVVRENTEAFGVSELKYIVGFDRGHFTLTEIGSGYDRMGIWNVNTNMEVLGNIYEHPSLLQEEKGEK